MKKIRNNLSHIINQLLGKKYELGKCDCFHIIYDYLQMNNIQLPDVFENLTIDNYQELYKKDPLEAKNVMIRFIESIAYDTNKPNFGDILLLEYKNYPIFLGIHAGNGNVLSCSPRFGVNVISRSYYKILRSFRWHKQFQLQQH